jgi:hypothetical protein
VGCLPKWVACGGRNAAFDAFKTALANARRDDVVALWIDSEAPVADTEAAWEHLQARDHWDKPKGAASEHVLFMTTCMETWIVADRATLAEHYGTELQESALPPLHALEERPHDAIQNALAHATRKCNNAYTKGKRSFEVLGSLNPTTLSKHLPSFDGARGDWTFFPFPPHPNPPPPGGREPCFSLPHQGGGSLVSPSPLVGEGWGGGERCPIQPCPV